MGLVEILPKYLHLKRRIAETAAAVCDTRPDVLVTIDSPDFCLRVARAVKARADIRCVHYVAPTVWAWRAGPGTEDRAGGRPGAGALSRSSRPTSRPRGCAATSWATPSSRCRSRARRRRQAFRTRVAPDADPLVLVLPGSRRSEVARLAPVFGDALRRFCAARPGTRVVVPAAPCRGRDGGAGDSRTGPATRWCSTRARSGPEDFAATSARPSARRTWRWPPRARSRWSLRRRARRWSSPTTCTG
jgi:lipid-A-disaccharide synthase